MSQGRDEGARRKYPLTSVVVTTRNEQDTIKECVMSLFNQSYINFEVIIVDAQSTDRTYQILEDLRAISEKFSSCKKYEILTCPAPTPAMGRNLGVKASEGDIIAFTDGDCVADRDWLLNLVSNLTNGIGLIGGPNIIRHFKQSKFLNIIDTILKSSIVTPQFAEIRKPKLVSAIPGCNMAVRRDIFEKIGGFDESLRYNEDTIISHTIHECGYKLLYTPEAKVSHFMGVDSYEQFLKFIFKYGLERGKNIPSHPVLFMRWVALSLSTFIMLIGLTTAQFFIPFLNIPFLFVLLIAVIPIFAISLRILVSTRRPFTAIMSVPMFILIFFLYNTALLRGLFEGVSGHQTIRNNSL